MPERLIGTVSKTVVVLVATEGSNPSLSAQVVAFRGLEVDQRGCMADLAQFSQATFESEVLKASGPVLVDFTASWCHPCHMLEPVVRELADSWTGRVKVGQVDVDANSELAVQYGVMGVPTLILFIGGRQSERVVGFMPRDRLQAKLEPHLPATA